MIHRINVFLLCSLLALCPAYVLAGAAEKWEIVENVYDTSKNVVNVTAKKVTQQASNSGVYKVQVPVNASTLGSSAKMMLKGGVAVAAITALVEGVGWVIDEGSKTIKKPIDPTQSSSPQTRIYIRASDSFPSSNGYGDFSSCRGYYSSLSSVKSCLSSKVDSPFTILPHPDLSQLYTNAYLSIKDKQYSTETTIYSEAYFVEKDSTLYTSFKLYLGIDVSIPADGNAINYREITDQELGNEILGKGTEPNSSRTPASDIIIDAYSPNNPVSDAPAPKQTNDALNNANPQPEKEPEGKAETEKEKDENGEETGKEITKFEWPNACEWFPAACEFFKVQKQDNIEIKENQKEDIAQNKTFFDKVSDWFDWSKDTPELKDEPLVVDDQPVIDYQHVSHVQFGSSCPFSPQMQSLPMGILGSMDFETDLTFICDFGTDAKPYVVSLGHLGALIFLLIGIRNGNG